MKSKYILTALCSLLLLCQSSCKKYLDKKPNSQYVVVETINDAQALLDDAQFMNTVLTPSTNETSADDYFLLGANANSQIPVLKNYYIWNSFDYPSSSDWSFSYRVVYNSNVALEILEKYPRNSQNGALWDNIKGSALFFRAYSFLNLSWQFTKAYDAATSGNDPGIVLRLHSDFNEVSRRASVRQSYDQLISDATASIAYLPETPAHLYRPSKIAAYGLLARAYLSMRDYENAFKYADMYLQKKNQLISFASPIPVFSSNPEIIFYTEMNNSAPLHTPGRQAKIDTVLFASYASTDLRRTAFFQASPPYQQYKKSYSTSVNNPFTGIATDEIYLIRAECYARKGDTNAALTDLNTLLKKRYNASFIPVTAADANEALVRILLERRKELIFRGIRWMDIKRLNKENANIILKRKINVDEYTLQPNSNYYALPLPKDLVTLGIPQNPK